MLGSSAKRARIRLNSNIRNGITTVAISKPEPHIGQKLNRVGMLAALTLFCVMAGHVMLETGVDALFLANIPVEQLPIVTILMAFLALGLSRFDGGFSHRGVLIALQWFACLGTLAFWTLVQTGLEWIYYPLYVWSGIATSLVVVRFWLLLGDLFTIGEGKKAFAMIAMGGSLGALIGSSLAVALAPRMGGTGLLLGSSVAFGISTIAPMLGLPRTKPSEVESETSAKSQGLGESLTTLVGNPYALRVAMLIVMGSITLTLGDYLFKSVLSEEIAADALATWLSRIYLGLNLLSIAVLALGVTPIVRRLGVDRSLAVLPSLIGAAAIGVLAGGALVATICLKLADGMFRYSLYKTATELLYLPMTSRLRSSVKSTIDLAGQSGAKALGSVMILGLVALPESRWLIAGVVAMSAIAWAGLALILRKSYLDVFRQTLGHGVIETMIDHPELDLESAGSLIRALSDPDESRALAALNLLGDRGQLDLVPSLLLYHPSTMVVSDALDRFSLEKRDDIRHLLPHLIEHEDSSVRAAAVRATWAMDESISELEAYSGNHCLVVRASAAAGLLHAGHINEANYLDVVSEALAYELPDPKIAIARAAQLRSHPINRETLVRMIGDEEVDVALEAIRAICISEDPWFVSHLIRHLDRRSTRESIRRALILHGDYALSQLASDLVEEETPGSVRTHIPRTIARFESEAAAHHLLRSLGQAKNGLVHYKILKGLKSLLRSLPAKNGPERLDLSQLEDGFHRTLAMGVRYLMLKRNLEAKQIARTDFSTTSGQLLVDLLGDKIELTTGRLFLMLGMLYPREDFRSIRNGLRSAATKDRASAVELIETLLSRDAAISILDLTSGRFDANDPPPTQANREAPELVYHELLAEVIETDSRTLTALALYHSAEVGDVPSGVSDPVAVPGTEAWPDARERGLEAMRDLIGPRDLRPRVEAG